MSAAPLNDEWPISADEREGLKRALEARLPAYLHTCRWYGEKSGEIVAVEWQELGRQSLDGVELSMGIALVQLATGDRISYALPIALDRAVRATSAIATVLLNGGQAYLYDAIEHKHFHRWLINLLLEYPEAKILQAGMDWLPTSAPHELAGLTADTAARVSRAEQSNSSIIFGDQVIVKVFRKIRSGTNPDVEVGRFLTEKTQFVDMPAVLGEFRLALPRGEIASLGLVQRFVVSISDGWEYALSKLRELIASESPDQLILASWLEDARSLGATTAELHVELSAAAADKDFAPEPIASIDSDAWSLDLATALAEVSDRLERLGPSGADNESLIHAFEQSASRLAEHAKGFQQLIGSSKIRVHGDFHLGQTLRTPDERWVVLDFEGEPARPIEERRAKSSPLKDVAGMFRSFNYARGVTERSSSGGGTALLARWERDSRAAFLAGYLDRARSHNARFLPHADEDVRESLAAWELHKALYEIIYELNNRPDWVWLPLAACLKLV